MEGTTPEGRTSVLNINNEVVLRLTTRNIVTAVVAVGAMQVAGQVLALQLTGAVKALKKKSAEMDHKKWVRDNPTTATEYEKDGIS